MQLRPYQQDTYNKIHEEWKTHGAVLAVLATGAGKTVLLSRVVNDHVGRVCVIAHRQELVGQLSRTLAQWGIHHRIIAPNAVIRTITATHMQKFGQSFYDPDSHVAVAGVDTITGERGQREFGTFCKQVTLWVIDEAHHVIRSNKWGKAVAMFTHPDCKGLGVTATPQRTDGQGLGRHADGVFNTMIVGAQTRWLINNKFLTEYQVVVPLNLPSFDSLEPSKTTGDFKDREVARAVAESDLVIPKTSDGKNHIVGGIVENYQKFIKGESCIVFAPSVEICTEIEQQFGTVGIKAKALSAKTPDSERVSVDAQFRRGEIQVLINVALFDEGYDVPGLLWVLDAYPTMSFGRFSQRFGRMLRLMEGKQYGGYLDSAGNIARHGLPDKPRSWTLDRREKRASKTSDAEPVRTCLNEDCCRTFSRLKRVCPYCFTEVPPPAGRSAPEFVDGDLTMLDSATLARMRGETDEVFNSDEVLNKYRKELQDKHTPYKYQLAHVKRKAAKLFDREEAQRGLRDIMAQWAGYRRASGLNDNEIYRDFWFKFQIDWESAQSVYYDGALKLMGQLTEDMLSYGY